METTDQAGKAEGSAGVRASVGTGGSAGGFPAARGLASAGKAYYLRGVHTRASGPWLRRRDSDSEGNTRVRAHF